MLPFSLHWRVARLLIHSATCAADHYGGLSASFDVGPIYCSPVTAALCRHVLGVSPCQLRELRVGEPVEIDGIEVVALDANHCPGSVMFLFCIGSGSSRRRVLYCGDMRFHPRLLESPRLADPAQRVHVLYLDNTYCAPRFDFPPQDDMIEFIADRVRAEVDALAAEPRAFRRLRVLIGTYKIGKERILVAVAHRCACRVFLSPTQYAVYQLLGLELPAGKRFEDVFTTDPAQALVWAVPLWDIRFDVLQRKYGAVLPARGSQARDEVDATEKDGRDDAEDRSTRVGGASERRGHGDGDGAFASEEDQQDERIAVLEQYGLVEPSHEGGHGEEIEQNGKNGRGASRDWSREVGGASTLQARPLSGEAPWLDESFLSERDVDADPETKLVCFSPTGWNYTKKRPLRHTTLGNTTLYRVPYSEHSSFVELRAWVRFLRPVSIVPTVRARNTPLARILSRFGDLLGADEPGGPALAHGSIIRFFPRAMPRSRPQVQDGEVAQERSKRPRVDSSTASPVESSVVPRGRVWQSVEAGDGPLGSARPITGFFAAQSKANAAGEAPMAASRAVSEAEADADVVFLGDSVCEPPRALPRLEATQRRRRRRRNQGGVARDQDSWFSHKYAAAPPPTT